MFLLTFITFIELFNFKINLLQISITRLKSFRDSFDLVHYSVTAETSEIIYTKIRKPILAKTLPSLKESEIWDHFPLSRNKRKGCR